MSSMIQTAIAFPIAFIFTAGILSAAPAMYSEANDSAVMNFEYQCEQRQNKSIYSTGSLRVNSISAEMVYTSPERMQCLITSFTDSAELIIGGVKEIW